MDVIARFQNTASAQPAPNRSGAGAVSPAAEGAGKGGKKPRWAAFLSLFIFPVCVKHRVIPLPASAFPGSG